ncbi:MAG: L-threonylcarbamoyladenylate synthase [Candidatus Peribacteraceae bacterium]|nr:L-threonylcarbamoyladenylate synthase [Candidatus Peribacteraceae bacterium]MDD5740252.1 L-threonylcarbamoyladenylate synthase [Candidatus Peribacteraceae bacterium]
MTFLHEPSSTSFFPFSPSLLSLPTIPLLVLPPSPQAIDQALNILSSGGIVAHATETCYGFACDLTNPEAVARLFAIKKRPKDQPVSALFPSVAEAKKYVSWNDRAEELAVRHLPGPLTLILPRHSNAPVIFLKPVNQQTSKPVNQTVGIRVSSHPLAMEIAQRFGKPLSTTSANLHGQPNSYSAEEILRQFEIKSAQPDLILNSGVLLPTLPSTVIDLTDGKARTQRKGNIS